MLDPHGQAQGPAIPAAARRPATAPNPTSFPRSPTPTVRMPRRRAAAKRTSVRPWAAVTSIPVAVCITPRPLGPSFSTATTARGGRRNRRPTQSAAAPRPPPPAPLPPPPPPRPPAGGGGRPPPPPRGGAAARGRRGRAAVRQARRQAGPHRSARA